MKVLYITNYADMYGANISLFVMMSALKKEYHIEPYLLISGKGGDIGALCKEEGIPFFEYDFRISAVDENIRHKRLRKMTRFFMRYKEFVQIERRFRKQGFTFDLVHSNSSVFDIGLFFAKKWKIPHIWHIREFAKEGCGLEIVYSDRVMRRKYAASDLVITISDEMTAWIQQMDQRIKVQKIYNGVRMPDVYEKKFCKDGVLRFCMVGGITVKKNHLDVIQACQILLEQGMESFRLYIAGDTFGEYYEKIQAYLSENTELSEHIVFTGYCRDIDKFLRDKDVGIVATDIEGFGRVTVEYMANYMTVIGTNTGGTVDLINHADFLFTPHDIPTLTEKMRYCMDNREILEKNKQSVRKKAERYSVESNAEQIHEAYTLLTPHI